MTELTFDSRAESLVEFLTAQIGKPYKWGRAGPDAYDCSGLVVAAYAHIGVPLPHFTGALAKEGREIAQSELAVGDLVFPNTGHVQVYVGGGEVIEAPENGIPVRRVHMWGFWRARRILSGTPTIQGAIGVPGVGAVKDIGTILGGIGNVVGSLTEPHTWLRTATFLAGVALLLTAVLQMGE